MARALRAPRDPQWTAEGMVSDRWLPVSPSGRLDAFQWKVPLAELADQREVIEGADAPHDVTPPPAVAKSDAELVAPPAASEAPAAPAALPSARPAPAARRQRNVERDVERVIPLVHVPDDPGPEPVPDLEPEPEPPSGSRGLRLFK
jgi:HemY protein